MSLLSDLHAPLNASSSRGFVVVRGESKADAVAPPLSMPAAIPSPEPTVAIPNRRDQAEDFVSSSTGGNASDVPVSESGNKPAWARTCNGAIDTAPLVLGGSSSWPALSESAKVSTKPSFDGSASASVWFHLSSVSIYNNANIYIFFIDLVLASGLELST